MPIFFPQVGEVMALAELNFSVYREVFCFSLSRGGEIPPPRSLDGGRGMVLIGPEGGLSEREEAILASCERISFVRLPTNILRSTTALAAAMGYMLSRGLWTFCFHLVAFVSLAIESAT